MRKTRLIAFGSLLLGATFWAMAQQPPRPGPGGANPREAMREGKLKIGDQAPDFTLKTLDGKTEVKLSGFIGKRPVVLVFASYT